MGNVFCAESEPDPDVVLKDDKGVDASAADEALEDAYPGATSDDLDLIAWATENPAATEVV